ncbi:MATH and LRR domain-containing protein PFE0570w-like [Asparagus officinalis]|uniref:MATH and LRR domain-containing protein PFE0570w-like n=1 Tax=Asparagus officinalis TaxID=4686 RepID=UPI00098E0515|nr:MATH and LRR domain-containing protein PFE0570w-like [Asparagus officinalis]
MIEINRLNRIIEKCGRHDEVIDPVLLKSNIKKKITNEIRKKRRETQEEQKSKSSSVYKEEPTMQEHVHKIVEEDVMHPADDEASKEEPVTSPGAGVYSKVDQTVDTKVEDSVDKEEEHMEAIVDTEEEHIVDKEEEHMKDIVDKEEEHMENENFIVDNKGFDEDTVDGVDKEEDIVDKEKENVDKLEAQEEEDLVNIKHDVDNLVDVLTSNVKAKRRPKAKRVSKRSKFKRTPYTEGKRKKKEKISIDILESPEPKVKLAEKVTHFYPGIQIPTFDALSFKPMTDEEEALLGELNNELPDPTLFNLRIIDSTCAFVHNLKIPSPVAERLDKAEIESLTKFCSQKIHKRYNVIMASSSNYEGQIPTLDVKTSPNTPTTGDTITTPTDIDHESGGDDSAPRAPKRPRFDVWNFFEKIEVTRDQHSRLFIQKAKCALCGHIF